MPSSLKRFLPLAFLLGIGGLFAGGLIARDQLGLELTPQSVKAVVTDLGWKAPAVFVGIVALRQFLLLPSALVLPVGGAVFGAMAGTLLGSVGILTSAVFQYGLARGAGRDFVIARLGARAQAFQRRAEAAGPLLVGAATAHPAGPMSPAHWGSGLACLPLLPFVGAIVIAAPIRSFLYSFFGSTLLEPGTPRFYAASTALVGVALLPLAHRRTRQRIVHAFRPVADGVSEEDAPLSTPKGPAEPTGT